MRERESVCVMTELVWTQRTSKKQVSSKNQNISNPLANASAHLALSLNYTSNFLSLLPVSLSVKRILMISKVLTDSVA